ncbi:MULTISPECIES: DUF1656 domain-containing protein [Shewanella]|uniref:DUF1656 domain-containing protein n=1 Tax=Shewanella TaxID=22 RepID=UPI0011831F15|nr:MULTISPECIES: DUF1656 domain-containing protein [Shewanella]QYJ89744.1 DUF1656 domain-containing protein [Shewanella halotolerans]TVP14608.1 hypothetical protein AYI87_09510 [Shewanella sp. KCT]
MNIMPHEIAIGDVYFPPLLLVGILAYLLGSLLTTLGTKLGWHKYLALPAIAELSITIILVGVISQFISIF